MPIWFRSRRGFKLWIRGSRPAQWTAPGSELTSPSRSSRSHATPPTSLTSMSLVYLASWFSDKFSKYHPLQNNQVCFTVLSSNGKHPETSLLRIPWAPGDYGHNHRHTNQGVAGGGGSPPSTLLGPGVKSVRGRRGSAFRWRERASPSCRGLQCFPNGDLIARYLSLILLCLPPT